MRETFASDRLAMRPHRGGDAVALHAGYGDAATMRWWSTPPHADAEATRAYLVGDEEDEDDGDERDGDERDGDESDGEEEGEDAWQGWTVTRDSEPIGTLSAGRRRKGVVEIGYLLVPAAAGQGYGREMVGRLCRLLIEEEGARRLYADVDPDNIASVRLLEGLGFRLEGRLRQSWDSHIGIRDSLIFGLLADEWRGEAPAGGAAARHRALTMLVRPVRLTAAVLALLGLALAIVPGVPRVVALLVLGIALVQLVVATVLRRRLSS